MLAPAIVTKNIERDSEVLTTKLKPKQQIEYQLEKEFEAPLYIMSIFEYCTNTTIRKQDKGTTQNWWLDLNRARQ